MERLLRTNPKPPLIERPMTREEVLAARDDEGYLTVTLRFSPNDLISAWDVSGFNDLLDERVLGEVGFLSSIDWWVAGAEPALEVDDPGIILLAIDAEVELLDDPDDQSGDEDDPTEEDPALDEVERDY